MGRSKSAVSQRLGQRGRAATDGRAQGAGTPAVGPCVTGTHSSAGEHRQWAETGLLDLLEIKWKRKDMRGIRQF